MEFCEIKWCSYCGGLIRKQDYDIRQSQWTQKKYCDLPCKRRAGSLKKGQVIREVKEYTPFNQIDHGVYAWLYQRRMYG